MRVLIDEVAGSVVGDPADERLDALYAPPRLPWLRVNMVATLDGAATGTDGRSGSINDAADHRVFGHLRGSADAILVGAGTARAESYGPAERPVVVVSRRGQVPDRLRGAAPGRVVLATTSRAAGLGPSRELLGADHVLVAGEDEVDLAAVRDGLHDRGLRHLLGEGGPRLLRDLLAARLVDELCLTLTPRLLAGDLPRVTGGAPVDVGLRPAVLLEEGGTLLGRWLAAYG